MRCSKAKDLEKIDIRRAILSRVREISIPRFHQYSRRYCIFLLSALDDIGVSSVFDSPIKIENEATVIFALKTICTYSLILKVCAARVREKER